MIFDRVVYDPNRDIRPETGSGTTKVLAPNAGVHENDEERR